ncbi:MAG: hypothetical protein U1G07_02365 [Verrucomicrobiota bacterium]
MRINKATAKRAAMAGAWAATSVFLALLLRGVLAEEPTDSGRPRANMPVADSPLPPLPKVARPLAKQPPVGLASDTHLDKKPPRATKGLDLVKAGWTYNCMECHKLFPARWHYDDRSFNEHKNIVLDHGNNRFCLNCHHPVNRNAFVDYDGAEIAQADVVKLCAKCHGTIYRDWLAGVHGRENGFWKADLGEKTKLRCIQCHDPHSPKFKAMQPLPPLRYPSRAANPPPTGTAGHPSAPH